MNILMGMLVLPMAMFIGIAMALVGFSHDSIVVGILGVAIGIFGFIGWIKCCEGDWDFERNIFR